MNKDPLNFVQADLIGVGIDLFQAGPDTVAATLSWLLMYLTLNQDVQDKCHAELRRELKGKLGTKHQHFVANSDQVQLYQSSGTDPVDLEDQSRLPFIVATLMETQRLACVAPAGLDRRLLEDVHMGGYHMPKGTQMSQKK